MNPTDICYLSISELRDLYQRRELSPVEVTRVILDHIDRRNPDLNAFVTVTPDLALKQARLSEQAYATGNAPPLSGIPGSLKDLTVTRGIRTTKGSLLSKDWVPDFDAPIVERLYQAGMVMLGKTNTPEMGWKGDSGNRIVGPTHNPWKHGHTAGGSSGGAAAAVAAGLSTISQGSDGAGSIRIPASFSGVYGFKPSWGLVPYYPPSAVAVLSHIGPITRTVYDAALMLKTLAGPDPRDPTSLPGHTDYTACLEGNLNGLRVAWSPNLGYAPIEPEVQDISARAAARFEELGCHIEEAHPDLPDPWEDILSVIWGSAFAGLARHNLDEIRDSLDPGLLEVTEQGFKISGPEVAEAYMKRNDYYQG
ncbi:MAG: amidase family protein, partial [bacterium]|nr:amidase family protein [bacterium]